MSLPELVIFDRDGTLIVDVPYNGDPNRIVLVEGAQDGVDRLRKLGCKVAIATNQSGVARNLVTLKQVQAVNDRLETLLGPFDSIQICPHGPNDGCTCRKPKPELLTSAATHAGVPAARCFVIGDKESDVEAAVAANMRSKRVLCSSELTTRQEPNHLDLPTLKEAINYLIETA